MEDYNSLAPTNEGWGWVDNVLWEPLPLIGKVGVIVAIATFLIVCFRVSYNKDWRKK